jgi:hypothetical protein
MAFSFDAHEGRVPHSKQIPSKPHTDMHSEKEGTLRTLLPYILILSVSIGVLAMRIFGFTSRRG